MTMVLLGKPHKTYFMIEGFEVTLRKESVDKQFGRMVKAIAEVMTSDIVMDIEEPTHSTETVLSIFAGYGGLGFKLCEERPLDCPPSEKARSLATYARLACRQAFPNINKTEADKMASALLALLAWLVDHLPKASDTELAMHLFGQASHISPQYFKAHLPYTLLRAYENRAEEMAMWLLNSKPKEDKKQKQKTSPQLGLERYVEMAIQEKDIDSLNTYKHTLEHMLLSEESSQTRELYRHVRDALTALNRPDPPVFINKGNYNAHVEHQTNTGLSSQPTVYNPSATA